VPQCPIAGDADATCSGMVRVKHMITFPNYREHSGERIPPPRIVLFRSWLFIRIITVNKES